MTNTNITIPTESTYKPEVPGSRRPARTVTKVAAGVAAGLAFGFLVASVATDSEVAPVAPAATAEAPAVPTMTPDTGCASLPQGSRGPC